MRKFIAAAILIFVTIGVAQSDELPRGRLPDDVIPTRYQLALSIDPSVETFSGEVSIDITVRKPVTRVWLHGLGLKVESASATNAGKTLVANYKELEPVIGVAELTFPQPLALGTAILHLRYSAAFRTGAEGLFRLQDSNRWYAFTQMEPIDARRMFPGFDEPRFKTPFAITVTTPASNRVVANAPLRVTAASDKKGWVKHEFAPTLPLPTYLVALAVGPLDIVEGAPVPPNDVRKTPLPLRGVAVQGQGPKLEFALRESARLVTLLEQYFRIPFPYPKLDLIASSGMGGAMENAGAILFQDSLLLLGKDAPLQQQKNFAVVTAHELAHQWFGDLVTPSWWEDTWLNESFAEWMGNKIADQWRPDFGYLNQETAAALDAMSTDSLKTGRPIHQPLEDSTGITSTFDEITYLKGAAVLGMVESYLGPATFQRGVQQHLRAHMYGTAQAADFFGALADAAHEPAVLEAFRSFIDQTGVPLVRLRRNQEPSWELRQERYRQIGVPPFAPQHWKIPFCASLYSDVGRKKTCLLLGDASTKLVAADKSSNVLVMPNADGAGYYRFALPLAEWDALIARGSKLSDREALMLADSVQASFLAGELPFAKVLATAQELAMHPSRLATIHLAYSLADMRSRLVEADLSFALRAKLGDFYYPRLQAIGFDPKRGVYAGDPADQQQLRRSLINLLAIEARKPELRKSLSDAAIQSLKNPDALDPAIRDVAWSVGVQDLGLSFATDIKQLVLSSDDIFLKEQAGKALGSAIQPEVAVAARELAVDPRVAVSPALAIIRTQLNQAETRDDAWRWFKINFEGIRQRLPGFSQAYVVGFPESFCDTPHRREIEEFLRPKLKEIGGGELELERTLEKIDICIAQRAALGEDVRRTLTRSEPIRTTHGRKIRNAGGERLPSSAHFR